MNYNSLGAACFFCFCVGIIFTTGAGEYWLTLFDNYGAMGLTLIGLAEILAVMYVYGHKKFTQDVEDMTGVRPGERTSLVVALELNSPDGTQTHDILNRGKSPLLLQIKRVPRPGGEPGTFWFLFICSHRQRQRLLGYCAPLLIAA